MRRREDPWALGEEGRLKELTSWLEGHGTFDVNSRHPQTGQTLLYTTVAKTPIPIRTGTVDMNYVYIIRLLCEKYNADIGAGCIGTRRTPLHLAAQRNGVDLIQYLAVKQGGPITEDAEGVDPYQLAVRYKSEGCAKILEEEMLRRVLEESNLNATQTHHAGASKLPQGHDEAYGRGRNTITSPRQSNAMLLPTPPNGPPPGSGRCTTLMNPSPAGGGLDQIIADVRIVDSSDDEKEFERWENSAGYPLRASNSSVVYSSSSPPAHGKDMSSASPRLSGQRVPPSSSRSVGSAGNTVSKLGAIPCGGFPFLNISQAPPVVQQELKEFQNVYGSVFDTFCEYQPSHLPSSSPYAQMLRPSVEDHSRDTGVYILRIRGLLPYVIRGNVYYAPVILLGFYPAAYSYVNNPGSPFPDTPLWAVTSCTFGGRTPTDATAAAAATSVHYPRFRAMVDQKELNNFSLNARATVYLDPLTGCFLPSPSDHLFGGLTAFTKHAVVKCFEAIPPMVAPQSQAALPLHVPFRSNKRRQMTSSDANASVTPLMPAIRMWTDALTHLPLTQPPRPTLTGSMMELQAVFHSCPFSNSSVFFSPLSGEPLNAHEGVATAVLLPFTAARHPWPSPCSDELSSTSSLTSHSDVQKFIRSSLEANHLLKRYQVYQDLSLFGDGLLAFLPDSYTVAGLLPVLGSRPQTVLVADVHMGQFVTSVLRDRGHASPTVNANQIDKQTNKASVGSPTSRSEPERASPTGTVYRLDVANIERLWNVRVRIVFDSTTKLNDDAGSPLDGPPRVFFPDAGDNSATNCRQTSALSPSTLTRLCFENSLIDTQTGELNPSLVTVSSSFVSPAEADTLDGNSSCRDALSPHRSNAVLCRGADGGPAVVMSPCCSTPGTGETNEPGSSFSESADSVCLLTEEVWGKQPRPLLALLFALKDLSTQLLGTMATREGDKQLMAQSDHFHHLQHRTNPPGGHPFSNLDSLFEDDHHTSGAASPPSGGLSSRENCIVCLSAPKDIVFLPCQHLALCRRCAALRAAHELSAAKSFQMIAESWTCCVCSRPVKSLAEVYV